MLRTGLRVRVPSSLRRCSSISRAGIESPRRFELWQLYISLCSLTDRAPAYGAGSGGSIPSRGTRSISWDRGIGLTAARAMTVFWEVSSMVEPLNVTQETRVQFPHFPLPRAVNLARYRSRRV